MFVNLLTHINDKNLMPNWAGIQKLVPQNKLTPPQLEFAQAHESTFYKIRYADYHLFTLEQIYRPHMTNLEEDTQNWARA